MKTVKSYEIPKSMVWEAYKRVKANKGGAGIDNKSIEDFEKDLENNLYRIWNRMSSGSYFPPAVRIVEIPKVDGKKRKLGIPTVSDRIAQMVVKMVLEPEVEPYFHPDSYGYRPNRSAHDALAQTRQRCWRYDWVMDLDIKGFFDNLDHELVMKAVKAHTHSKWVLLYIERWLKAPAQYADGTVEQRGLGTPQGGVISPLLANLFLHYAFDKWMERNYPHIPFERYADDVVTHCKTEAQAKLLQVAIARRLKECGLEMHPEKTKVVYCKDANRKGSYPNESFDFLGYTFRSRGAKNQKGQHFIGFLPAASNKASKAMRQEMRRWKLHLKSDKSLEDLGRMFSPVLMGWINYYGQFHKTALYPTFTRLNRTLVRWVMQKHKRFRGHQRRATHWLGKIAEKEPRIFPHWSKLGFKPVAKAKQ